MDTQQNDTASSTTPAPTSPTPESPTTPPPATPAAENPDNTVVMGVLAYLGPLVLIPLITEKNNPFVRYHVRQGLVLFILEVVLSIFGWILFILLPIVWLGILVLTVMGILNVVNKKEAELPLIGQFAKYFHNV